MLLSVGQALLRYDVWRQRSPALRYGLPLLHSCPRNRWLTQDFQCAMRERRLRDATRDATARGEQAQLANAGHFPNNENGILSTECCVLIQWYHRKACISGMNKNKCKTKSSRVQAPRYTRANPAGVLVPRCDCAKGPWSRKRHVHMK